MFYHHRGVPECWNQPSLHPSHLEVLPNHSLFFVLCSDQKLERYVFNPFYYTGMFYRTLIASGTKFLLCRPRPIISFIPNLSPTPPHCTPSFTPPTRSPPSFSSGYRYVFVVLLLFSLISENFWNKHSGNFG